MRTIITNLYQYSELNEQAKRYAINHLRERAVECASESDWMDANDTLKRVKEIAHVRVSIQQSSQGYYADWYTNTNTYEQYGLTDKDEFYKFKQDFENEFVPGMWCDYIMQAIVRSTEWDNVRISYASNVAWMLVKFCEAMEDNTVLYYKDECVEEWICSQDFEFTEYGRLYNQ